MNQGMKQSINKSINQSINQSIIQPFKSINQSTNQSIKICHESTHQSSINQSTNHHPPTTVHAARGTRVLRRADVRGDLRELQLGQPHLQLPTGAVGRRLGHRGQRTVAGELRAQPERPAVQRRRRRQRPRTQ